MTTPGGVPNLPAGALTLDTLAPKLQDMSGDAMKSRAVERFPTIFNNSTGLDPALDITPFGILTRIWAEVNSLIANADPADIQGPEDLPELVLEFIEGLPVIGQFVEILEAILGEYDGDDETLLAVQAIFAPIRKLLQLVAGIGSGLPSEGDITTGWGLISTISNVVDQIFKAITGIDRGTNDPIIDLQDILQHIPFLNVLGVGGPSNIGGSITSGWDQLIGGFVGALGSGAGLADLFNIGQDISSRATRGAFSFDILGIRNNKSMTSGFLPTSQSNISLDKIVMTPNTVGITQSTALTSYKRIEEAIDVGVVSWQGQGVTSVTDCYVNIYKMSETTGDNGGALHGSANIIGNLSGSMQQNIYSLPTSVHFEPGDIAGFEIAIRGAGTHTVLGAVSTLVDQSVYPRRWSSVRNSGVSAAPSTTWTPTYSNNVPFIEFGVSASPVAIPHSPEIHLFNTAGTVSYPIPSWVNFVEVIAIGGGGGGHQGGTWGIGGEGGDNGPWATKTWARGADFTGIVSATVTVGAPGTGGTGSGANGGNSVVLIPGRTVTAIGGLGANNFDIAGSEHVGESPGNTTYNSVTYVGGAAQNTYGANGAAPGGGGAGGNWISFQSGGDGAPGAVWLRFRQT